MTMAQRYAGVLRREGPQTQSHVMGAALKLAADTLEALAEDNEQLLRLLERASDVALGERDRAFARANGGIRKLRSALLTETRRVEAWFDERSGD